VTDNIAGAPAQHHVASGDILRQVLVIIATVATIVVNYLANSLPINNLSTGEISDRFAVLFVPAGYVFSIWGLIYLGLIGYSIFQALPANRANPTLRSIGYLYILSALANISWIFLWHYEQFVFTVPVMLVLLGSLIAIYRRVNSRNDLAPQEQWFVRIPFSVYLGWITVATVANVTAVLDYLNWGRWGINPEIWFAIMLLIATAIGALVAWLRRDVAYVAVLVWAFAGIAVKHSSNQFVWGASVLAALVLAVLIAVVWRRQRSVTVLP
jgi:hypothetical protein